MPDGNEEKILQLTNDLNKLRADFQVLQADVARKGNDADIKIAQANVDRDIKIVQANVDRDIKIVQANVDRWVKVFRFAGATVALLGGIALGLVTALEIKSIRNLIQPLYDEAKQKTEEIKKLRSNIEIQWNISTPIEYDQFPGYRPRPERNRQGRFQSYGGDLIIFCAATAISEEKVNEYRHMRIDVLIDKKLVGSLQGFSNEKESHKTLCPAVIVVKDLESRLHDIEIVVNSSKPGVFVDTNDFSQVTVLEIPKKGKSK